MTKCPIEVSVAPEYLPEQSDPNHDQYAFAYHITISNRGGEPARLVSRHWLIVDGHENRREVQGLGVVGKQPRLLPGENYSYTSGVVLETTTGTMEGSYRMVTDDGTEFDAAIPVFLLAVPGAVH